jgi:glucose/arabinose dehydrogenase
MRQKNVRPFFILSAALVCWLAAKPFDLTREAGAQAPDPPVVSLSLHVSGLSQPVGVTHAGDGSGRLFILEQGGRIRIFKNGSLLSTPFLDISGRISSGGEQGLLGLAFPPDYARKGYFYVNYTLPNAPGDAGDTVIARFRVSATNPDAADPASEQRILVVAQPFQNHNGGHLAFGPRDGLLYAALGDGGSGGDPGNRAQNPAELLGKVLRLDVETGRPFTYTVPASNPFVGRPGQRPEIWASGLRNPWRFSFDRATGDLFIGDVGQNNFEEIDFQPAASRGGENYGWRILEGRECFNPNPCVVAGLAMPVWVYTHAEGCSVTGGYVYRGPFPRMRGLYFYGDYCSGRLWALRQSNGLWQNSLLLDTALNISSFGEDEDGNLYVASHNTGEIFALEDEVSPPPPVPPPLAELRFAAAEMGINEHGNFLPVTVTRTGNETASVTVGYRTENLTASDRSDYTTAVGRLRFAPGELSKSFRVLVTSDDTLEGNETFRVVLENPSAGATLATPSSATVSIVDDDPVTRANPIDRTDFFVRQHYFDFLNRFPDPAGEAFWVANVERCGADAACREARRVDTSAAFFLAIEFQETGYFVYRVHKAAFGDLPGRPVPVRREVFLPDMQAVGRDIIVGVGQWQAALEANKRSYLEEFVTREAFVDLYPTGQTPAAYVDALNRNAGSALSPAERDDLVARLSDGRETRATALRRVAEDATLRAAEFNKAFVLMQYFGYLRRNPDDGGNQNFGGWRFWLDKLEANGGDYRRAEMVKAFIVSIEYRRRFGQ